MTVYINSPNKKRIAGLVIGIGDLFSVEVVRIDGNGIITYKFYEAHGDRGVTLGGHALKLMALWLSEHKKINLRKGIK